MIFLGVLAATNLSKMPICSSSITKIALWWILTYRTIIPVITAHISFGNQSINQFWSSDTLGSHFYNLKYSSHHRNDRNIWEISREIWQWKSILKCQNRLQCIRTSMCELIFILESISSPYFIDTMVSELNIPHKVISMMELLQLAIFERFVATNTP